MSKNTNQASTGNTVGKVGSVSANWDHLGKRGDGPARNLLEVRDLQVAYGGIQAVRGISFDVPEHEIVRPKDIGLDIEVDENGTTFEENALIKARAAAASGYCLSNVFLFPPQKSVPFLLRAVCRILWIYRFWNTACARDCMEVQDCLNSAVNG